MCRVSVAVTFLCPQEYLPRALVVELCLEDFESCRVSSTARAGATGYSSESPASRDWFKRAMDILAGILSEWKRNLNEGIPSIHASSLVRSCDDLVSESTHPYATPNAVAEAILNSVHCCIAAVGVSLGQDMLAPLFTEPLSQPHASASDKKREQTARQSGRGCVQNKQSRQGSDAGIHEAVTGLRGDKGVKALRRIGRLVASAAAVDAVGQALCKRCFCLLANPTR